MNAKVIQFRRGKRTVTERHFLIQIEGLTKRADAMKFIGNKVVWKSPAGKEIKGKIASPHGNKGVLRAIFEKGLPGQSISTPVQVEGNK
jgi:large subunit ribosomal protein L35Ae